MLRAGPDAWGEGVGAHTNMAQQSLETPLLGSARSLRGNKTGENSQRRRRRCRAGRRCRRRRRRQRRWRPAAAGCVFFRHRRRRHKSRMRNFLTWRRQLKPIDRGLVESRVHSCREFEVRLNHLHPLPLQPTRFADAVATSIVLPTDPTAHPPPRTHYPVSASPFSSQHVVRFDCVCLCFSSFCFSCTCCFPRLHCFFAVALAAFVGFA